MSHFKEKLLCRGCVDAVSSIILCQLRGNMEMSVVYRIITLWMEVCEKGCNSRS